MPVVRWIRYVYNSCMGLALLSLHIPAKKCILSIDDGPFFCNCRPGDRSGVSLHPAGYPVASGWDAVKGRTAFYAHAPSFGAGGINGRMTLAAVQTGATYHYRNVTYPIRKVIDPVFFPLTITPNMPLSATFFNVDIAVSYDTFSSNSCVVRLS